jgi:hypothetical protein
MGKSTSRTIEELLCFGYEHPDEERARRESAMPGIFKLLIAAGIGVFALGEIWLSRSVFRRKGTPPTEEN